MDVKPVLPQYERAGIGLDAGGRSRGAQARPHPVGMATPTGLVQAHLKENVMPTNATPDPDPGGGSIPVPPPHKSSERISLSIRNPQDLLSAIPYLLQYQPRDILVIVFARTARQMVIVTVDVPTPSREARVWDILAADLDDHCPDTLYLIAYVPAALSTTILECARLAPLPVNDVLRVHDGHWWGLRHNDPACTSAQGTPIQPQDHILATLTLAGLSVASSWDELAAGQQPAPTSVLNQVHAELVRGAGERWTATDRYQALWAARQAREEGPRALPEAEAARLLRALSHATVRDAVLDWHDDATWWLWNDLIRLTPPNRAATVELLLATTAYLRSDTSMAMAAADRAFTADRGRAIPEPVLVALAFGLTVDQLTQLVHTTATAARTRLRAQAGNHDTLSGP